MKRDYIKPSIKDHTLNMHHILQSTVVVNKDEVTGDAFSKQSMLDWGGLDDDLDQ